MAPTPENSPSWRNSARPRQICWMLLDAQDATSVYHTRCKPENLGQLLKADLSLSSATTNVTT